MGSFEDYKQDYIDKWAALQMRSDKLGTINHNAGRIIYNKDRYQRCVELAGGDGPPWWFYGLVHMRESFFDFHTFLGNGQSLDHRTTEVPIGEGPFHEPDAFEHGCRRAMEIDGLLACEDWNVARTSWRFEKFNGFGYRSHHVNPPYLYSGSNLYGRPDALGGKFTSDHHFDPTVEDVQLGTMTVLRALTQLDADVKFTDDALTVPVEADDHIEHGTLWIQQQLEELHIDPGPIDGILGRRTKQAIATFQKQQGLTVTGLPNAATINTLDEQSPRHIAMMDEDAQATLSDLYG